MSNLSSPEGPLIALISAEPWKHLQADSFDWNFKEKTNSSNTNPAGLITALSSCSLEAFSQLTYFEILVPHWAYGEGRTAYMGKRVVPYVCSGASWKLLLSSGISLYRWNNSSAFYLSFTITYHCFWWFFFWSLALKIQFFPQTRFLHKVLSQWCLVLPTFHSLWKSPHCLIERQLQHLNIKKKIISEKTFFPCCTV